MLHERVKFELQLPSKVRQEFRDQSMYPEESYPGYPTTSIRAVPDEYEAYEPAWIPGNQPVRVGAGRRFYRYPFLVPRYGMMYGYEAPASTESPPQGADPDGTIPGTDLTKSQLSEKVTTQIQQNKSVFEQQEEAEKKLLNRRENMEENTLKKSVTFDKDRVLTDLEAEYESGDLDFGDSGRGSAEDLWLSDVEGEPETRDIGVGTSTDRLLRKRRTKSRQTKRPPWRYWPNDPAPDLIEPMHYGPYRVGPYEPWLEPPPIERRCIQRGEFSGKYMVHLKLIVRILQGYKSNVMCEVFPHT